MDETFREDVCYAEIKGKRYKAALETLQDEDVVAALVLAVLVLEPLTHIQCWFLKSSLKSIIADSVVLDLWHAPTSVVTHVLQYLFDIAPSPQPKAPSARRAKRQQLQHRYVVAYSQGRSCKAKTHDLGNDLLDLQEDQAATAQGTFQPLAIGG